MKKIYLLITIATIICLRLNAQDVFEKMREPWKYSFSELQDAVKGSSKNEEENKFKDEDEEENEPLSEILYPLLYDFELHQNKDGKILNYTSATWNAYYNYLNVHYTALSAQAKGDWSFIGPSRVTGNNSPGIGRVNSLKIITSQTWLAGAAGGGLWKTTDEGGTWKCLTDGLPDIAVSDIAVDPSNSNIIYILTGDGDASHFPSIGVLKTTDGGKTWKTTALTWSLNDVVFGHHLIIDNQNTKILWATTSKGIYRTADGGASWPPISSGVVKKNTEYFDIEFKPGNTNYIYTSTKNEVDYNSNYPANKFVKSGGDIASSSCLRVELTVTPADASYVYAIYVDKHKGLYGVYRSVNGGACFKQQCDNNPNYLYKEPYLPGKGQGASDLVLLANPTNKDEVILGGKWLWKSVNGAQSFTRIDDNSINPHAYVHNDYHWAAWNGNNLVTGSDGGVWESNSALTTFTDKNKNLGITQFYHLGVDPFNPGNYGGGAQDNGILLTTNSSTNFNHPEPRDGMEVIYYPYSGVIAASQQRASIYISTDGGVSFNPDSPEKKADAEVNAPLILTKDKIFYSSVEGALYKGTFTFISPFSKSKIVWTPVIEKNGMVFHKCAQLASGVSTTNRFYAIYHLKKKGYFLRCDNMHDALPHFYQPYTADYSKKLDLSKQLDYSSDVQVDPLNSLHIYVTFSGYGISHHVWESATGGKTFHNFSGSLPDVPVYCIKPDGGSKHGVYLGTEIGVFFRNDDTKDWIFYSDGMPVVQVHELFIVPVLLKLRAATYGRGLWESPLYAGCTQNVTITKKNYSKGNDYEQASNNIISTAFINGSVGDTVTYNAGNFVRLDAGFECKAGGELHAFIQGCTASANKKERTGIYAGKLSATDIKQISLSGSKGSVNVDERKPGTLRQSEHKARPIP